MKKLIFAFLFTLIIFAFSINNNANALEINYLESNDLDMLLISTDRQTFEDGSYVVTTLYEYNDTQISSLSSTITKDGEAKVNFYNSSNVLEWTYTLYASFDIVEGESAVCTNANYKYSISKSNWKFSDGNAYYEDNVAYGKGTFKYKMLGFITSNTRNINISITCDNYGNLTNQNLS